MTWARWEGTRASPTRTRIRQRSGNAVDAAVECRRGGGEPRRLPIADLVVGPYQTSLEQGELLTAVRIPALPDGAAVAHAKFSFHERPTATVACLARVVDGVVAETRVAVGSVGVRPVRSRGAEDALTEAPVNQLDDVLSVAGERAAEDAVPVDDATGSADYKAQLVKVLVERTFRETLS